MSRIKDKIIRARGELILFVLAIIYRIPTLGYEMINDDASVWKARGYEFGEAIMSLDFARTAVTYHPGVPLLWSQFTAMKVFSLMDFLFYKGNLTEQQLFFINHFWQKLVLVFITSILITFVYRGLKNIIDKKIAFLTVIILLIEPFYLALSRVIHNDALLTLFMFLTFIYSYLSFHSNKDDIKSCILIRYKYTILSGFFAGCALLTKSSALYLFPFVTLEAFLFFLINKDKKILLKYVKWLLLTIFFFVLIWPAMWVIPAEAVKMYVFDGIKGVAIEEGHRHMWFGNETYDPGILFYPLAIFSRITPFILVATLSSLFIFIINFKRNYTNKRYFIFLNIIYIIFYLVMISITSKKIDRYILPILPPMIYISIQFIFDTYRKKLVTLIMIIVITTRVLMLFRIHPYYMAYYSAFVGGLDKGRYVIEPKWEIGYKEVAKYFNEKPNSSELKVTMTDYYIFKPYTNFKLYDYDKQDYKFKADYLVLLVWQPQKNNEKLKSYSNFELIDKVKVAGIDYYYIYKIRK